MGWGAGRGVVLTSPGRELALPAAVPLDAEVPAILVPVPDQQLTTRPDHLAGSIEDLPVILQGHQVLLLIIPGRAAPGKLGFNGRGEGERVLALESREGTRASRRLLGKAGTS